MRTTFAIALLLAFAPSAEAAPIHIDVTGPQSGTCIAPGPHVWATTVRAGHSGGHFRWAGYQSHRSGCEPHGEHGSSSFFAIDGPLQFNEGLGGITTWAFQRPGRACGRIQYDIDWWDYGTGWIYGVAGIVVDYGIDCGSRPADAPPAGSVPEPALLAMVGLGLLGVARRRSDLSHHCPVDSARLASRLGSVKNLDRG